MFKMNKKPLLMFGLTGFLVACSATQSNDVTSSIKPPVAVSAPKVIKADSSVLANRLSSELTLEQIMANPDWMGRQPTNAYWGDGNSQVYYSQKREGSPVKDLWTVSATQPKDFSQVSLTDIHRYAYKDRVLNHTRNMAAWIFEGNIFTKDLTSNQIKQLTKDNKKPSKLVFLNDGRLSFQSGNGIYAIHPLKGFYEQLASWQFAEEPLAIEDPADYIAEQQQNLIAVVALKREHKKLRFEQSKLLTEQNNTTAPTSFYFPPGNETVQATVSPNGNWLIVVEQEETSRRDDGDIMPNYINEDGRITSDNVRRRVADATSQNHNLWLLDLQKGTKKKLSYSSLPGYNEDVLAAVKQENAQAKGEQYTANRLPRDITLMSDWYWSQGAVQWHKNGEHAAIMLEAWDNKDRWLATVDTDSGKLESQHRLHDDAWVNYKFNSFGWLHGSNELYYLSEESGYSHLYVKSMQDSARALTSGKYEVDSLTISQDEQTIFFKGNKKHPGIYEVYRVNVATGELQTLTELNGMTDYQLSPDEQSLLLTHSSLVRPPELYVQKIGSQANTQLTFTTSQQFLDINWLAPDIVPIQSSYTQDPIYSRVYSPRGMHAGQKYKAVVFNHGAGYLQNSHLGWSGYFREFMFHNMLVQQGYVVLDMDYRASAGYGRDWRTAIYRQMGTPEIQDLQDGVNWLVKNLDVDAKRVGTYGGSYGGFMTFMALFNAPDLFQAGAALRPVSDWAHYNHGYTSNILNTPDVDPIAYERSSPIYFAQGLEKPLLINAPMVDSNVFFVDVVRLVQRLIELEKQDFETAIYPVESHGFVQPSSWLDEYRRIYKLFETNL
jgi:dipeptidyl aminopeptidase/acylaminoacyl peptidase